MRLSLAAAPTAGAAAAVAAYRRRRPEAQYQRLARQSAHRPHSRKLGRRVLLPGVALIHACERRS
jgi:hypothetical protein